MLMIAGRTTCGNPVVRGVWQFRGTYGAPFELIFEKCKERGIMIDWLQLFKEVPRSKHEEILLAMKDTYGEQCWNCIKPLMR